MIGALVATFGVAIIVVSIMLGTQLGPRMRAESERVLLAHTDGFTGLNNRRSFGGSAGPRMAPRPTGQFRFLPTVCRRRPLQGVQTTRTAIKAGDDELAAVARCIGGNIRRPADTAARYGGEEFVVLLPDTPETGAAQIAERIRAASMNWRSSMLAANTGASQPVLAWQAGRRSRKRMLAP